jgi:hypothetical protein
VTAYGDELDRIAVSCIVEIILAFPSNQNFTIFNNSSRNPSPLQRGYLDSTVELTDASDDLIIVLNGSLPSLESARIELRILLDRLVLTPVRR